MNYDLKEVLRKFISDTSFFPVFGCELEFYISNKKDIAHIQSHFPLTVEKEQGENQFEVKFDKNKDVFKLAENIVSFKNTSYELAKLNCFEISFSGKPQSTQPPSSLQVNISLEDINNINIFTNNEGKESEILLHSIAGLLEFMTPSMAHFAPFDECYKRFLDYKNAPSTISWGNNNRTTAIRIPTVTNNETSRRIEHRVPCACSNPHNVFAVILNAIAHGIANKSYPKIEKTYGNAYDEQYGLEKIAPKTL